MISTTCPVPIIWISKTMLCRVTIVYLFGDVFIARNDFITHFQIKNRMKYKNKIEWNGIHFELFKTKNGDLKNEKEFQKKNNNFSTSQFYLYCIAYNQINLGTRQYFDILLLNIQYQVSIYLLFTEEFCVCFFLDNFLLEVVSLQNVFIIMILLRTSTWRFARQYV